MASRTLLAAVPDLGAMPNGRAAALVGLAPLADDSGRRRGRRRIGGGRKAARDVLYMAAAQRRTSSTTPALKAFADRLEAAGKEPKVVLIAVARKLLVIANAILRSKRPWDLAFAEAT